MELKPIYIPFKSIFPALVGYLGDKTPLTDRFPLINQKKPYGKAHKGATAIERQINGLHLIMHRIRIGSGINILPDEKYTVDFRYLPVDFLSFFVWLRMIMDSAAFLTPFFYDKPGVIPGESFSNQLKWFIETRPQHDGELSNYLRRNLGWFGQIRDTRSDLLHWKGWSYADVDGGEVKINQMSGNRVKKEFSSITKTVGEFYINFVEFSKFYEEHFAQVLKIRGGGFREHDVQMVSDIYASLDYIVGKAGGKLSATL